jgi:hypothetical protein
VSKTSRCDRSCIESATARFVAEMTGDYVLTGEGRNCDRALLTRYFSGVVRKALNMVGALHRCSRIMFVPLSGHSRGKRIYYALPLVRYVCKECGMDEDSVIVGVNEMKT